MITPPILIPQGDRNSDSFCKGTAVGGSAKAFGCNACFATAPGLSPQTDPKGGSKMQQVMYVPFSWEWKIKHS